jgi:hypothetical protein
MEHAPMLVVMHISVVLTSAPSEALSAGLVTPPFGGRLMVLACSCTQGCRLLPPGPPHPASLMRMHHRSR